MPEHTIKEVAHARDLAQKHLEAAVVAEFPIGVSVTYNGIRGETTGHVDGHDGEMLLIGKVKRHWTLVRK